jgi:tetratricopeptide (TPR) repeat protein
VIISPADSTEETAPTLNGVAASEIRSQLDLILRSGVFIQSHRIRRFLQFVVEESLAGRPERLKEYVIGVEVFDRRDAFDPRVDSIVRVEARRLRYKLEEYYRAEGRTDPVRIVLRKGSYVPFFEYRTAASEPASEVTVARRQSDRQESCEAYLEGRYCWKIATPESIRNSVTYFTTAVEGDPNYAAAWAALAEALLVSSVFGLIPPEDANSSMTHASARAILLNSSLPEAQVALGAILSLVQWDWDTGEEALFRSIQLDGHDPVGRVAYGIQLACRGRLDRAVTEVEHALELDPASLFPNFVLGWLYGVSGRFDAAIAQHLLVSRLATDSGLPALGLAMAYSGQGQFAEAIAHLAKASHMRCGSLLHGHLGYCYARLGRRDDALQEIGILTRRSETHYVSPLSYAAIHAGLGEHSQALGCLERAAEVHDPSLPIQLLSAEFDNLRDEPRFQALRKRIGLVQSNTAQVGR